jgi:hypothetical protein
MKKSLIVISVCLLGLIILFSLTDPNRLPSFVLIVPFVLIFVSIFTGLLIIMSNSVLVGKRARIIAAMCASVPTALLIMQSIGQLTSRDILTIFALFMLAFFYVSRVVPKT